MSVLGFNASINWGLSGTYRNIVYYPIRTRAVVPMSRISEIDTENHEVCHCSGNLK